jgi:KDO2-lipid IV(A) lauroyltransferase
MTLTVAIVIRHLIQLNSNLASNKMKKLLNLLLTGILLFLTLISLILTRRTRTRFGKLLGRSIYYLSKKRRLITFDNLQKAFPEKDVDWIKKVCIGSFENLGITFAELFAMYKLPYRKILSNVQLKYSPEIQDKIEKGNGFVILTGHFGNWELAAFSLGLYFSTQITIIVKPQSNQYADIFLNKIRTRGGNKIVSMYHSAFEMVKVLKNREGIALIADQSATADKDVFVDFFGRLAATYKAPAQIALKFNVPMLIGFAIRQNDYSYIVDIKEIDHSDLQDNEDGIYQLTLRHTKMLEQFIRQYPDHWVWQHRRWKHQPKD